MHARVSEIRTLDRTTFEFRKIYIFMQCAPDPYEFFQSIFGLIFGHMTEIVARRS